jgi:hypothetical protein
MDQIDDETNDQFFLQDDAFANRPTADFTYLTFQRFHFS